jgi:ATP-binding cassette, subfamily B, bacterial
MARPQTIQESLPTLWQILLRFRPYVRKQKAVIGASFVALFAEIALRLVEPWPLKLVFDHVIVAKHHGHGLKIAHLTALDANTTLTVAALAVVAITGLRSLADYLNTVGFALAGNRVLTEVRNDLYRHLQCLSLSFHNQSKGGDLTLRVMSDIGVLTDVTTGAALPLLGSFLLMLGMACLMLWLSWKLALIALVAFPLFGISVSRLTRRITDLSRSQRLHEGAMAATAAETIGAIKVVQALSLEEAFAETFSQANHRSLADGLEANRLSATLSRSLDLQIAVATAAVLWAGARLTLTGALTAGELVVFLSYLKSTFRPLQDFAKNSRRLSKAVTAGERVIHVLDQVPETRDLPGAVTAGELLGAIQFQEVGFAYEPGRAVLENVDLDLKAGQHVALVGKSGSGKSTLVSLILRLYDATSGTIRIDGLDIREYTLDSLRGQISVVLQDSLLFAATIRDNIAYGVPDPTEEGIEAAARLANAHQFISSLPEGYDTVVGERGVTVSSGQRQRISIARAAIRRAPILILDEPTTGLDNENSQAVIEALERLAQGRTTFLITHNLQQAERCDLILYLERGYIIERGSHQELMKRNGLYASLYRLRAAQSVQGDEEELPDVAAD